MSGDNEVTDKFDEKISQCLYDPVYTSDITYVNIEQ